MKPDKSVWACYCVSLRAGSVLIVLAGLLVLYIFLSSSSGELFWRKGNVKSRLVSRQSSTYQNQLLRQAQNWYASGNKSPSKQALQTISQGLRNRGIVLDTRQWEEYFPGTTCPTTCAEPEEHLLSCAQSASGSEFIQWCDVEPSDTGLNNAVAFLNSLDSSNANTNDANEYLICSAVKTLDWQKNPLDRICLLTTRQVESLAAENIRSALVPSGILTAVGTLLLTLSSGGFAPNTFLILFASDQRRQWMSYLERIQRCLLRFSSILCLALFFVNKSRACPNRTSSLSDIILNELNTVRLLF